MVEDQGQRHGVLTWMFAMIGIVVTLAVVVGGFYVWRVWSAANDLERSDTLLPSGDTGRPAADAAVEGSLNFILMGSDSRGEGDRGRSDVLMLAHVPPSRDQVFIVSFPRDMWVEIPGRGEAKINAAHAYGGEALATRTLESLVGVRMDHAVLIDFEGFIGLTNQLGGVTVDNKQASTIGAYAWPKGPVTLQGEEALSYVRQRYGLPGGDLDRAERQRTVVKGILEKLLTLDVLANPPKFNEVMGQLSRHVTVDEGLTSQEIFGTATSIKARSGSDIVILQAPISGFGRSGDGQSIDIVNKAQLAELADAVRTGTMRDYADTYADQPLVGGR